MVVWSQMEEEEVQGNEKHNKTEEINMEEECPPTNPNVRQQSLARNCAIVLGSGQAPLNKAASTGEALKWRLCCTKYKCSKVAFAMEEVAQALRRSRDASAVLSTRRRGTSQRRRGPRCCAGAGVQRWNLMSRVFSITHKRHRPQQNGSSKVGQRGLSRRSSRVLQEQGYDKWQEESKT